jgi:hypothetical protein
MRAGEMGSYVTHIELFHDTRRAKVLIVFKGEHGHVSL